MFSASKSKQAEDTWTEEWEQFCDKLAGMGPTGEFVANKILRHLTLNAPVVIGFVFACALVYSFTSNFGGQRILGVHDTWNTFRFLQYPSLLTHIFAHSGWGHLSGNVTHLLLVGPSVEHEFGSLNLLGIMFIVAVVSAFAHILLGNRHTHQLGASGVVFACILLNSLVSADNGKIPVAFILIATLYLGEELALFFNYWNPDGVSHHAHLTGGLVGAAAGFYIHHQRRQTQSSSIFQDWKNKLQKKTS